MPRYPIPKKNFAKGLVLSGGGQAGKKRKSRSSHMEISERREMVLRMRLKGRTFRQIAKDLGVGYMTIKRDFDCIKEDMHKKVTRFDQEYALGKSISTYEQIEDESWKNYFANAEGSSGRAQFLNLIRAARNDQVKLLSDVGLINRAPQQHQHKIEADAVLQNWTDDAKRIVALAIIRSQMEGVAPPSQLTDGSPIIEVEATSSSAVDEPDEETTAVED